MRSILLLIVAVAACGRPPAQSPAPTSGPVLPRDLAGCYALERTQRLYYASPRVRLNTDTIPRMLRLFAGDSVPAWTLTRLDAEGRPMEEQRRHPALFWAPDSARDSIRVMIHTGLSGSELKVHAAARADTLHGRAWEHWDVGPHSNDAGRVALVRIPCTVPRDST